MSEPNAKDGPLSGVPRGRIVRARLILLSLFAIVWTACAASPGVRGQTSLPPSGLMLSAEYAGYTRGKILDNERTHPGLGITMAYHGGERGEATIYIYNLGQKNIPDGPTSNVVRAEFDKTTREVFEAGQVAGNRIELVSRYGTGEFLCSEFIITEDHGSHRSFLYVTGANENFVKIRITLRTNDETDATARNFADAVASGLWKRAGDQPDADELHISPAEKN